MKQRPISCQVYRQRCFLTLIGLLCGAASILFVVSSAFGQYADWKHLGSIYILTTPEGANLPASGPSGITHCWSGCTATTFV